MLTEITIRKDIEFQMNEPYLMVPQRMVEGQFDLDLVQILPVYPPEGVIPTEVREPFIPVPLDEVKRMFPLHGNERQGLILPIGQENPALSEEQADTDIQPAITESGLLVITCTNFTPENEVARRAARQIQRMDQYWRFMSIADHWGINLEKGHLTPDQVRRSPPFLRRLRRMGIFRYADELAPEPLTHDIAKNMNMKRTRDIEEAMAGKSEPNARPERQKAEKPYENPVMEYIERTEESLRVEQEKQQEYEAKNAEEKTKATEALTSKIQENTTNIQQAHKILQSGVLYVHDPLLDEPSEEAASYIRELLERPF